VSKEKIYSDKERRKILSSIDLTKAYIPVFLGIGVVVYLFFRQFDPEEFAKISWDGHAFFFLFLAVVFLVLRIVLFAVRLMVLSEGSFSFLKTVQLTFIWMFSSAVSPTNVGGSAVALFIISQEKIGAAKATAIVIYTIVLDTLFFLIGVPFWYLVFGTEILGPGKDAFGGWTITLLSAYVVMFLYGAFFSYGLFVKPQALRALSRSLGNIRFLKRYQSKLLQLGDDIVITSKALVQKGWLFHLKAILTTIGTWCFRFFLIISLIMGITNTIPVEPMAIMAVFAKIQAMFVMMILTPTPGGAGLAEIMFGSMLSDYVPSGVSLVVATIWRLLAYYFFLLMGVVIIPPWLKGILRRKRGSHLEN